MVHRLNWISGIRCETTWRIFRPKLEKILKNPPEKNSSYFEKWNFLTPILKNFLYILLFQETSNKFYTFHEMVTLKKLLIFRKMELFSSRSKKFLLFSRKKAFPTFRETETLKQFFILQETELSYISGNPKKNFLYFREQLSVLEKCKTPTLKKLLIFLEKKFLVL